MKVPIRMYNHVSGMLLLVRVVQADDDRQYLVHRRRTILCGLFQGGNSPPPTRMGG